MRRANSRTPDSCSNCYWFNRPYAEGGKPACTDESTFNTHNQKQAGYRLLRNLNPCPIHWRAKKNSVEVS